MNWTESAVNLAVTGAAWVVADSLGLRGDGGNQGQEGVKEIDSSISKIALSVGR
jgi:hypothetical protein